MKKFLLLSALFIQTAFAFAEDKSKAVYVRYENVKMYQQPGTSTEIIKALNSTDEVVIVRKYNKIWTIVTSNGAAGYVLTSELGKQKPEPVKLFARK